MKNRKAESGLLSTELAILMPIMLLFALLAVYVVQVERHSSLAQQAADAAARSASLAVGEPEAQEAARIAASAVCGGAVTIEQFTYNAPDVGSFSPGSVALRLTCSQRFSAFEPLVQDSTRTEVGVAVSAIEYWRPGS